MNLKNLLDYDLLKSHIENGLVSARKHPTFPLTIYNYTAEVAFGDKWDDVTEICRGLIADDSGEVIARPFRKFWNLNTLSKPETLEVNLAGLECEVSEKLDGSLGILYSWQGEYYIATRGSFVSEQAQWANKWYQEHLADAIWSDFTTPLFEIIFKNNKIVVDYDFEGLVLLAIVRNDDGYEWPRPFLEKAAIINGCVLAKNFDKSLAECATENAVNAEGYVLRYGSEVREPSLRIKVKFAEYVRLHRLLTGVSPKAIWELLRDTGSVDSLCENVPETFVRWVRGWREVLLTNYAGMEIDAKTAFGNILYTFTARGGQPTRKQWAEKITACAEGLQPVLFRMLDGKPYSEIIWKRVRPEVKSGDVFRKDPDTTGA